jgi:hypothetical protein
MNSGDPRARGAKIFPREENGETVGWWENILSVPLGGLGILVFGGLGKHEYGGLGKPIATKPPHLGPWPFMSSLGT